MPTEITAALVTAVTLCVRQRMEGQQAGHGFDHVDRVLRLAQQIQSEVGGNRTIVELAAVLHDIGDAKFHQGIERSGEFAQQILAKFDTPKEIIDQVVQIVDNISFRKRSEAAPLSLEGQIVQDADRLDALGAIGIVRTIEYGAAVGQPFYLPDQPSDGQRSGVGHFHEKLFRLKDLLNTSPAKRIAIEREQFMQTFLDQFMLEWG